MGSPRAAWLSPFARAAAASSAIPLTPKFSHVIPKLPARRVSCVLPAQRPQSALAGLGVEGFGFVSHYTSRLDAKGRVSIPAAFRAVLAREGTDGLYIHHALALEALDCGGLALRRQIDEFLAGFSPYSEEFQDFSVALKARSEILKIDTEGRAILGEGAKNHAGITNEVTFVGLGFKFQIWEPGRFRVHQAEATSRLRDFTKQLGARSAARDLAPPRRHGARE